MGDNEMRRLFANNLRYYLNLNGYTQADMARYMKVSTATTAKWCTGVTMPRVDKIQSLCNWFGIEKSDLLDSKVSNKSDTTSDKLEWYDDPETAKLAQELHDNPDLRILLDASRDLPPEKLRALIALITPHIGEDE